ncbi:hypothetical protein N9P58_01480 [Puniceicoccaceae bacterium]|nr:hypothetical protein [Puniceicoccaceae bacterium]
MTAQTALPLETTTPPAPLRPAHAWKRRSVSLQLTHRYMEGTAPPVPPHVILAEPGRYVRGTPRLKRAQLQLADIRVAPTRALP